MKLTKALIIFILVFSFFAASSFAQYAPDSPLVTTEEAISWATNTLSVSGKLIKAFSEKEAKITISGVKLSLFGAIGLSLDTFSLGKKLAEEENWEAAQFAAWSISKTIIEKLYPTGYNVILAFEIYLDTLKIIHKYAWIPFLTDKMYEQYRYHRRGGEDAWTAYNMILYFIEPVIADTKERIGKEKYNLNKEELTPKFQEKIKKDTDEFLIAVLERRYQKEIGRQYAEDLKRESEKNLKLCEEKLRDVLEMPVRGIVIDAATNKPSAGIEVGVEGKRHHLASRGDGTFYFTVPYKLVEGRLFHLYAKAGKEIKYSRQITWQEEKTPYIRFILTVEEKPAAEPKIIPEPTKLPAQKIDAIDGRIFWQGYCEAWLACGYNVPVIAGGSPPYLSVEHCVQYQLEVDKLYGARKSTYRDMAIGSARNKKSECAALKEWLDSLACK